MIDITHFAQQLADEIARRGATLPVDHSGGHREGTDAGVADEWLLVECDVPVCKSYTTVDVAAADPAHDELSVRAVLADRGWSLDGKGRDLCPQHSSA